MPCRCSMPVPTRRMSISISQSTMPNCRSPRFEPWSSYCAKATPWIIAVQSPHILWLACIGLESGIQLVPDPIRTCEMPSGPFIIAAMSWPTCAMPGISTIASRVESRVAWRVVSRGG